MEYTNAAGMCQTAATGQCPNSMSHTAESDEQDIEIIPGDSRYWEDWENEVQYNSGRSSITEVAPPLPSETSNQPPASFPTQNIMIIVVQQLPGTMTNILKRIARFLWWKQIGRVSHLTSESVPGNSLSNQMIPQTL